MLTQPKLDVSMLRSLIDGMETFAAILNLDGTLLFANEAPLKATGLTLSDVINRKFWDCPWWDYDPKIKSIIRKDCEQAASGQTAQREIQLYTPQGLRWISFNVQAHFDENDNPLYLVAEGRDIEKRRQVEKALEDSEQKYRLLFEQSADATLIFEDGRFVRCNRAAVEMLGYDDEAEILEVHPAKLSPEKQEDGQDSFSKANDMIEIALREGSHRFEWSHCRKNGEIFPVEVLLTSIVIEEKYFIQVVWRDITEQKRQKHTLEMMAHYDVLTQLPNRNLFADRFNQAVAHSHRTKSMLAICFLDLDSFKPINDNYGHEAGDQLLIEVASRLTATIREGDSVSRQGGDEFVLLLCDIESFGRCEQVIKRIRQALAQPYFIDGQSHKVSVSMGITLYPEDDADLDTLIRHADQAMYQAKLAGKDQYQLFNPHSNKETVDELTRIQAIEQALVNEEFKLYYQPKINMKTGEVFGAEALIRWLHPQKGLIPPLEFLPIIEGTELEAKIGGWVINQALTQMDSWQQQSITLEVSVNVSSHHLQSPVFFEQLSKALARHPDVDSRYLQLEILESSTLGDINVISRIIKACQSELGVNVALDDFGTGYSSLTHMKNLPANTIKIDQSFVRGMLYDPDDYNIIQGIIALAEAFNRDVIAEGVETEDHGLMLLNMGCCEAQGYGISRPMPAADFSSWIVEYTPYQSWINYGKTNHSGKQAQITLFKLTTQHWFEKLCHRLVAVNEEPFGSMLVKCHLGVWLSHAEKQKLFDPGYLNELTQAHNALLSLAGKLIKKHKQGNIEAVRDELDSLNRLYQQLQEKLENPR
jgi:diguanylate cyclase (GGDEF)-like protein/PAS domain S-box-containing protein